MTEHRWLSASLRWLATFCAVPLAVAAAQAMQEAPAPAVAPALGASAAEDAAALVDAMWDTMGGKRAYDAIGAVKFTFAVERGGKGVTARTVTWDRVKDRARFDMKTDRGELLVFVDLASGAGSAFENGLAVPEQDRAGVVDVVRGLVREDLDWLVLPWRMRDPGVTLSLDGSEERDGKTFPRVKAAFGADAGNRAGDTYWLLLDPGTHLPVEWSYRQSEMRADQAPVAFACTGWHQVQGVKFSTEKRALAGNQRVLASDLAAFERADEAWFTPPRELVPVEFDDEEPAGAADGSGGG